ncbi:pappalysin-2 [Spinachia spinachia]
MCPIRLAAVFLVLITNTWLFSPVRSDALRRYKRAMARRADGELSRLAGEPCAVYGLWRSRRQARSTSPSQHRPQAARPRTRTSRGKLDGVEGAPAVCAGGCGFDTGARRDAAAREDEQRRGDAEEVAAGEGGGYATLPEQFSDNRSATDRRGSERVRERTAAKPGVSLRNGAEQTVSSGPPKSLRASRSRFTRSLGGTFPYGDDGNSSWEKVSPDSSSDSPGLRQDDGEQRASSGTPEERTEDSSGEVEEADAIAWGSPVPAVPASWMTALYFGGRREQLRMAQAPALELPRGQFSLELWVKPEGGQSNPAVIAGVFDNCSHSLSEKGWSVGIRTAEPSGAKDARFYFTLRTDRAVEATTVYSHQRYRANAWTHLMATYNGHKMRLYVDGAQVGESSFQAGNLYSPFMKTCRSLFLGSNQSDRGHSFRGHIGGVVLWGYARSHEELLKKPLLNKQNKNKPLLAMWADFTKVVELWTPYKVGLHPTVITAPVPEEEVVSPFLPPPCGLTPCDNNEIIFGYNNNFQLRATKRVRYRVVNLSDDDGGNPTVSADQIQLQHRALIEAFHPYNISLDLSVHTARNSSLRQRFILSNCRIGKIGNRRCDPECDHSRTGHDGGDCLRLGPCYNWKRQDGVCDTECNSIHYDYDDGDCCDPEITDVFKTCFDPESLDRAYMSVKELKEELHLSGSDTLNVFFASNSVREEELAGAATWPWAKEALTHQGGIVLNPSYFGTKGHHNTMIHEMGHILGLYHVFKGVSERDSCDDPCQETTPSMETGDLCADTAPTTKSKACRDPGAVHDTCGLTTYNDTPYTNYMSYTDDNCTDHFTPNQVARMHCYLDLMYQNWLSEQQLAPIPLAPIVTEQSPDSVSIYWLPPMRGALYQSSSSLVSGINCGDCETDGVFHQYASEATSPRICDTSGYWTPEEAVGPPDVEQPCDPSLQAWSPELSLYDTNVTSPCPDTEGCTLTLKFLHPIIPQMLTLWVTYVSSNNPALADVELITAAGKSINLGPQHIFCDMPFTLRLDTQGLAVAAVKLATFDEKMEVDAAMLSSGPGSPLCSGCRPLLYRIQRLPPFAGQSPPPQTGQTFTDSSVRQGLKYQYTIQLEANGLLSDPSLPLLYTHGQFYCGDGFIQGAEECDDSNLLDGDGCSKSCQKETDFNCNGEPSRCYVFDGDGVCEEFERGSSVRDCGYFTPLGYTDQWASAAAASHQDPDRCPAHAATGEPSLAKLCRHQHLEVSEKLPTDAWFPCTAQFVTNELEQSFWLKVGFVHPGVAASVIVYLASDGSWSGEQCSRTATILLSDTTGMNHSLGTHDVSCHQNPLVVNVTHDLSRPFFITASVILLFSSPSVAVGGVALRTSCHFSTFAQTGCLRQPCQLDSCAPLQIEHASVRCTGGGESSQCSVQCHRGFSVNVLNSKGTLPYQRESQLECFHGAWDRLVSCQPVDCGMPDQSHVYHAIFSCPWGTTFGKQCSFTCGPPAILQGDSDRLVCLEDGLWDFPEAYCKIECPEVPNIADAKLLMASCLASGHDVGSVCRYKCNPGFYVVGSLKAKIPRKYFKLECLQEGLWEETTCEPISCSAPPDVFQGMYTCTNGLYYDTLCTLQCPDATENREIRCTKQGGWSAEFTMCATLQGSCSPPANSNSVEYSCDLTTDVGAFCYPTCIGAADMDLCDPAVLPNGTTVDSVKHWMLPTGVQSIVCTGMMKWYPDPQHIHCIQSCEPFRGDGWCDTINNRAYCQYDGGDCCPSTLSTRKVIQFGADCNQDECTCRDPDAEENKSRTQDSGMQ